LKFQRNTGILQ